MSYFQKESHSVGYKKVTNIHEGADLSFGENSILGVQSEDNLELILPEITSFSKCEIYYSYFNRKSYTLLIVCKGLGDTFIKKMVKEKNIRDFNFREIFSENKWFITPVDANNVLISTDVDDITKAIKRSENETLLFNEIFLGLKQELPQSSSEWFITNDNTLMSLLFKPFIKDTLSVLEKIQDNFISLIFYKEPSEQRETKPVIIIEGTVDEEINNNIVNEIKSELNLAEYRKELANSESYNFSNVDISNINNKFKIIIK